MREREKESTCVYVGSRKVPRNKRPREIKVTWSRRYNRGEFLSSFLLSSCWSCVERGTPLGKEPYLLLMSSESIFPKLRIGHLFTCYHSHSSSRTVFCKFQFLHRARSISQKIREKIGMLWNGYGWM